MNREDIKPLIIDLLKKEGFDIVEDNIKIWNTQKMIINNVLIACEYIKYNRLNPILVYTNKVPLKEHLEKTQGIKIFDIEDLQILSIKHNSKLIKYI